MDLTESERWLLIWLATEKYNQYGECHGPALDSLVNKGFAQIHEEGEYQSGFIAQGRGKMYRAVSLTESGLEAIRGLTS